jgi:hypothetical protein
MAAIPSTPQVREYLADRLWIGDPDVNGPLAVFPLFGPAPVADYLPFSAAATLGACVTEVEGHASVNDLVVVNPLERPVLLYEGETVIGAQQNRTFDLSVLIPADTKLNVPVSCVEAGRWDGSRNAEPFAPAPQTSYPELRRSKARQVREQLAVGGPARARQHEVWSEIARRSRVLGISSPTAAMHDIYAGRRGEMDQLRRAITLHDGQTGTVATMAGHVVVLDYVSRPDAFATLHAPLVEGYLLDALHADAGARQHDAHNDVQAFLAALLATPVSERDGIGLGREIRFAPPQLSGSGLVSGDELLQLTAFAEKPDAPQSTRIRRPSRRQRG